MKAHSLAASTHLETKQHELKTYKKCKKWFSDIGSSLNVFLEDIADDAEVNRMIFFFFVKAM